MKEVLASLDIIEITTGFDARTTIFHIFVGNKIIAVRSITVCLHGTNQVTQISSSVHNQLISTCYDKLGTGGVVYDAHAQFHRPKEAVPAPVINTHLTLTDVELYNEYSRWYRRYIKHYERGIVLLHEKPPLTLNAFILIKRSRYWNFHVYGRRVNYELQQTRPGCWYYLSDIDTPYTPYVREYSKLRGVLTVYSVYDPDEERADTQPVAHMVASDMHFAMFRCTAYADVAFEW